MNQSTKFDFSRQPVQDKPLTNFSSARLHRAQLSYQRIKLIGKRVAFSFFGVQLASRQDHADWVFLSWIRDYFPFVKLFK